MYLNDSVLWASVEGLAMFFTVLAVWFPFRVPKAENMSAGVIWAHIRAVIFPFFAGASWYVLAAMSVSLNNCISAFGTCFTSPTFSATTTTITTGQFDYQLYLLFEGLALSFLVAGSVLAFYFAFRPLIAEMNKEPE